MDPLFPSGALLALARVLPVCALLAAITRRALGWSVATALGISLALAFGQGAAPSDLVQLSPGLLALRILRELCLGSVVALSLLLPLWSLAWAARLAELSVGMQTGSRAGPLATLYGLSALYLALTLGFHRTLVIGLHQSFAAAPAASAAFRPQAFAWGVVGLVGEALALSLALGIPLVLSGLIVQASVGLVARLSGRGAGQAWGPLVAQPLLVLVAALLIMPLAARVPEALRAGLRVSRELARQLGT